MKRTTVKKQYEKGFTLVEVMISIGLFTVIMVVGIGAVLGVNTTSRKTQSMRAIIDNMSFIMEDMARSMRLGNYFVCVDSGAVTYNDVYSVSSGPLTNDGPDNPSFGPCESISFEPYWEYSAADPYNQIAYYINGGAIKKKDYNNLNFASGTMVPITPPEIYIDPDKSGFIVNGSQIDDGKQPTITIILVGTVNLSGAETDFNMQTTVSQRVLDVVSIPDNGSTTTTGTGSTGGPVGPAGPAGP